MIRREPRPPLHNGFTYIEVQVALALFMIAISGLGPLAVIQSKQLAKLEERFDHSATHYLNPSTDRWARKLGSVAALESSPPSAPQVSLQVIDNGEPNYSEILATPSTWETEFDSNAMGGVYRELEEGYWGNSAVWTFDNLEPGVYEVFATYAHSIGLSTDAPYRLFDGNTLVHQVSINQETLPAGNAFAGRTWDKLGEVSLHGSVLVVELQPASDDDTAADAVRIVPRRNNVTVTSVQKTSDTENMSAVVSVNVVVN